MFDTHIHKPRDTQFVTREIHEHKAPTDESVKLLKEFEEKAVKNILNRATLNDNKLNYTWMIQHNPATLQRSFHYRIKINHDEFIGEFIVNDLDVENTSVLVERMLKNLSESIAIKLIAEYVRKPL